MRIRGRVLCGHRVVWATGARRRGTTGQRLNRNEKEKEEGEQRGRDRYLDEREPEPGQVD